MVIVLLVSDHSFAQIPLYNSYPSASPVLYLDFDGHTISGSSWNYSTPTINAGPSNLNEAQITQVFNRIAEDYRPFNINITTDSTRYWAAPATQRMRVIFTITSDWYGVAGGVGYITSFTWGDNTPCFVFTALHNYNLKNISEAASHEAGHTLGLNHQSVYNANCVKVTEYNAGDGNGEIGWAPIMGVGYYRNFTVWHNGSNSLGCSNTQSDLDIITGSRNGFGYRVDDHSDNPDSATIASFTVGQFTVDGVISKTADRDIFKFNLNDRSQFQLSGVPYNVGTGNTGSDLDMQVELMDGANNTIGTYNPGNALNSIIDTALNAGTYYLRVDGKGNLYASEYGSLGSFSLQGAFSKINPLPLRRLELKGIADGTKHKLAWVIDADEAIVNQVLEVSGNGHAFEPVVQSSAHVREYNYTPNTAHTVQYRLKVTFDNGRQYYSNTIAIRSTSSVKPQLLTNVIHNNLLMISSPGTYSYTITNYNGRMISKGQVLQGSASINTGFLTSGMYVVRFYNGQEQYTEKFVMQSY
jgi:hypothetical protein